ncbi:MAG: 50S ribosomal protein L24 [Patescibacteria group bacterium]
MKIKKNDTIKIIAGKDRGKSGKVLKVFLEKNKILIEGLNLYKKHVRPKKQGEKGQLVSVPRPINISNVMLICSSCGKTSRISYRFDVEKKIRICKKCGASI